ncbi:hypothetical protein AXG93_399s1020 [Marchantia polymorpha subsp. ruderalis]|uniref:Uncharacterized protein n=1 Tax=Marchantia polymorpha subsp. ruderalis TaxID=1480154 RepID=A0A176WJ43_MARPO|nr:hypothetical protein AXG93_399s1020 [Marchantia polymorpha subsp. ruderalis]
MEPEEAETNDEWPSAEGLRPSEWRSSAVPAKDLMEEAEEQEGDTEVETLSHDRRPPREQSVYTLSGHEYFEVPEELANTAVDPNSMKELIDQVVEDVERTTAVQQPMPSGQVSSGTINLGCDEGPSAEKPRYLDGKMAKYIELAIARYYVELVRSRTQAKVTAYVEVAERVASLTLECATVNATLQERKKQLWQSELECVKLWRSLAVKRNLYTKAELEYVGLWVDISNARKVHGC